MQRIEVVMMYIFWIEVLSDVYVCIYSLMAGYSGKEVKGGKCREEVTSAICREE